MKTLALELSSARGSIALLDGAAEKFARTFANDRKHSGLFFENLQRCLQEHGNPDRIVVGLGPGSYAGTRIAIAAAIGLGAAANAELLGVSSVCGIETDAPEYCVIGDARRQTFFFAEVHQRRCVAGPDLGTESELVARLETIALPVFSTEVLPAFPRAQVSYPSARLLAEMAATSSDQLVPAPLEPMYLRAPHITYPKTPPNLIARP